MTGLLVNTEWESIWKEAVVAYFEVIFRNLSEGTEKNTKTSVRIAGPWERI
jgi:hypothetical protein